MCVCVLSDLSSVEGRLVSMSLCVNVAICPLWMSPGALEVVLCLSWSLCFPSWRLEVARCGLVLKRDEEADGRVEGSR